MLLFFFNPHRKPGVTALKSLNIHDSKTPGRKYGSIWKTGANGVECHVFESEGSNRLILYKLASTERDYRG